MSLKEKIEKDFVQARKERSEAVVSTLGMLRAAVQNAEIAGMRKEFTDEDILKVINSEVKKHKDSISEYEKGARNDLAEKEKKEMEILAQYLPAQIGEDEIKKIAEEKIKELGASGPGDFGKVMGAVMKVTAGRAGGDAVGKVVRELLSQ